MSRRETLMLFIHSKDSLAEVIEDRVRQIRKDRRCS